MSTGTAWGPKRTAALIKAAGRAGETSESLAAYFGTSRGAIAGKLWRLGIHLTRGGKPWHGLHKGRYKKDADVQSSHR